MTFQAMEVLKFLQLEAEVDDASKEEYDKDAGTPSCVLY
jgi:hypothetical protein